MIDRRADLVFAIVIGALGVFVTIAAQFIRLGTISDPIGPRGLPTAMGVFLIVAGVALVGLRLKAWTPAMRHLVPTEGREDDEPDTPSSPVRALLIAGLCVGYAVTLQPLGFILSSAVFVSALFFTMGMRPWWKALIGGVATSIACYVIFAIALTVRLPPGILRGLLRLLGLPT